MKIIAVCPQCASEHKFDWRCERCGGTTTWAQGYIKDTHKEIECVHCHHTIWAIECDACAHTIPMIGQLARFDDSDDPMVARVINAVMRMILGVQR